jgi:gluconolactonase
MFRHLCCLGLLVTATASLSAEDRLYVATPLTRSREFTRGIEGPACDRHGNIYAVSFRQAENIGKVSPDGSAELFLTLPGKSAGNGIVFAHNDDMNQPNDLAIAPDGTIYASDPDWKNSTGQIWMVSRNGQSHRVAADMGTTNGIEVSPDGHWLYVNESVQRNVWRFPIQPDGKLGEKQLIKQFPDYGFDGMRCDVDGNLYITRHGKGTVVVMAPDGREFREVDALGKHPTNLCFGGPDGKTVYVTDADQQRIVQFRAETPGLAWQRWQNKP